MTARYSLAWRSAARRDLKRLDPQVVARVLPAIYALADNPRPAGVKRLRGTSDDLWRIRVGDYRVVYTINDDRLVVLVVTVAGRGSIYRDL